MSALNDYFQALANRIRLYTKESGSLTPNNMITKVDTVYQKGFDLIKNRNMIKFTNAWQTKSWVNAVYKFSGTDIWTDGSNIHCVSFHERKMLDSNGNWVADPYDMEGPFPFSGDGPYAPDYWSDGTNLYYSDYDSDEGSKNNLKLNGTTWVYMTWSGMTQFNGRYIWTDGANIYYSYGSTQKKLNGTTWVDMTWTGMTSFYGTRIWTDGANIYYSYGSTQKKLNGTNWVDMTWSGMTEFNGAYIWTDGTDIYYSYGSTQKKLNGTNWVDMTWSGLTSFYGQYIWSDGRHIYYSYSGDHRQLVETSSISQASIHCKKLKT